MYQTGTVANGTKDKNLLEQHFHLEQRRIWEQEGAFPQLEARETANATVQLGQR